MKKQSSGVIASLVLAICVAFALIVQTPRAWQDETAAIPRREPSQLTRTAPIAEEAPPAKFASLEEALDLSPPLAPNFEMSLEEEPSGETASRGGAWPQATALAADLEALGDLAFCREWAREALSQLRRLEQLDELRASAAGEALTALAALAEQKAQIAALAPGLDEQGRFSAAAYALARRVAVWRRVHELAGRSDLLSVRVDVHPERMLERLAAADALLGHGPRSSHWRRWLLTGQTRLLAEAGPAADPEHRRRHARHVLRRMEWSGMSAAQREFLARPEFTELAEELRDWAAAPFDFARLLETLEEYEEQPTAAGGRRIADFSRRLTWAGHASSVELAAQLEAHYRNANVRAAISQEFLQRLVPQAETTSDRVRDTIVGAVVWGESLITTQISFRTVPDPQRVRLIVEATGDSLNQTRSAKSGAVFHSRGQAWFQAQKEIVFDGDAVSMAPAVAEAQVADRLRDVSTNYDRVPLVNMVAQALARQGHSDARLASRWEAEQKVARRVAERLDEEAERRLAEWEQRLAGKIGAPLRRLAVGPAPIELQTTSTRLIGRYRIAGDTQPGAHTPRTLAPADSLLSVQIHESAVNNALDRLPLAGREVDLPTLLADVAAVFGAENMEVPDDLPQDIVVRFADEEPLRVDLIDGQARVTIRLAELETGRRRWRNIMSRAYYRPECDGLSARMVRDGHLELTGDHLHLRDQLALRAIFAKVFTERRTLSLIPEQAVAAPQLQGIEVRQLVIRDGWLGIALGPERTATAQAACRSTVGF